MVFDLASSVHTSRHHTLRGRHSRASFAFSNGQCGLWANGEVLSQLSSKWCGTGEVGRKCCGGRLREACASVAIGFSQPNGRVTDRLNVANMNHRTPEGRNGYLSEIISGMLPIGRTSASKPIARRRPETIALRINDCYPLPGIYTPETGDGTPKSSHWPACIRLQTIPTRHHVLNTMPPRFPLRVHRGWIDKISFKLNFDQTTTAPGAAPGNCLHGYSFCEIRSFT